MMDDYALVLAVAAAAFGCREDFMRVRSRERSVVWPRQVVMAVLVDQFGWRMVEVARVTGRHHGTVLHALRAVASGLKVKDRRSVEDLGRFMTVLGRERPRGKNGFLPGHGASGKDIRLAEKLIGSAE